MAHAAAPPLWSGCASPTTQRARPNLLTASKPCSTGSPRTPLWIAEKRQRCGRRGICRVHRSVDPWRCRDRYPRLVVIRTLSKAHALAGARVGFAVARPQTLDLIKSFRAPASVSTVSAALATAALCRPELAAANVARIAEQRARLTADLSAIGWQPYPPRSTSSLSGSRHRAPPGPRPRRSCGPAWCLDRSASIIARRLSPFDRPVGRRERPPHRNSQGYPSMSQIGTVTASGPRWATVTRSTRETQITVTLKLGWHGPDEHRHRRGFYDHLLGSMAHHALFDLDDRRTGDLVIDEHHTVEDVALVLGASLAQALGDRRHRPLRRCPVPMDESVATAVVTQAAVRTQLWICRSRANGRAKLPSS